MENIDDHKTKVREKYHPDLLIFLFLIPFASAVNYYLTYSNIRFNGFLLLTFTIDTVQGYLAWLAVRKFILYLDKKLPFSSGSIRRIAIQIVCTLLIGLFIIGSTTELVSWIAKGKPAPPHFYTVDLVIISIWFFVINGIYIMLHFYHQWKQLDAARKEQQRKLEGGILVKHGKQELQLKYEQLAGLYVEADYVVACTVDGRKFLMDQSLDKIEKRLPPDEFFRLNRQYLVHRQIVQGFRRAEHGKIDILLSNHPLLPAEITVSRTKAPAFKSWFRPQ